MPTLASRGGARPPRAEGVPGQAPGPVLHSGGPGGLGLQLALIVTGASLALGFSPLVTHALVQVPLRQASDASGLLTTTIQLGQAVGVATFGSLFLALDSGRGVALPYRAADGVDSGPVSPCSHHW